MIGSQFTNDSKKVVCEGKIREKNETYRTKRFMKILREDF